MSYECHSNFIIEAPISTSGSAVRYRNMHLGTPQPPVPHQVSEPTTPRAPPPSYTLSSVASFTPSTSSKRSHCQNSSTTSTLSISTTSPPATCPRFNPLATLTQPVFSTGVSSSMGTGAALHGLAAFSSPGFLPSSQPASLTNTSTAADAQELGWGDYIELLYQLDSPAELDPRSWYGAMAVCPDCQVILARRHYPLHCGTAFCRAANQQISPSSLYSCFMLPTHVFGLRFLVFCSTHLSNSSTYLELQ